MNTSRAPTDDDADRELSELEKSKEVLPNFYSLMEKVNRVANGLPRAKLNPLDHTDFEMDVPEPGLDDDAEMDSDSDDGVLANCTIELLATVAKLPQSAYDAPHLLHESYGLPPNPEEPDEVIDISSGDEDEDEDGEEAAAKEEDAEKPIILLHDDGDGIQNSASSGTASTDVCSPSVTSKLIWLAFRSRSSLIPSGRHPDPQRVYEHLTRHQDSGRKWQKRYHWRQ
jgi:hypothetical protein